MPGANGAERLARWRSHSGVVPYCLANGIRVIAYRPLGGARRRRRTRSDATLADLAKRHDATGLRDCARLADRPSGAGILPIPGATRVETARSLARIQSSPSRKRTARSWTSTSPQGKSCARPRERSRRNRRGRARADHGPARAGKSTLARTFVARGYERLNRDERRFPARAPPGNRWTPRVGPDADCSRQHLRHTQGPTPVIQAARKRGLSIRCVWLATGRRCPGQRGRAHRGQVRTAARTRRDARTGKAGRACIRSVRAIPLSARLEPRVPRRFTDIEIVPFERRPDGSFTTRALIVWCEGVLLRSRSGAGSPISADDAEVIAAHAAVLRRHAEDGWRILGLSWQPEIELGHSRSKPWRPSSIGCSATSACQSK